MFLARSLAVGRTLASRDSQRRRSTRVAFEMFEYAHGATTLARHKRTRDPRQRRDTPPSVSRAAPRSSRRAPRATGRRVSPPERARFAGWAKKQRPVSFSPLLAPATRSREAAMVAASPTEGAMTVRKGMISRLECENFKCVPDTSRLAPIRAALPKCAFAFAHLERAPDPPRGRERENAVRRARRFRASTFADRIPRLLPRFLNAGRTRATR